MLLAPRSHGKSADLSRYEWPPEHLYGLHVQPYHCADSAPLPREWRSGMSHFGAIGVTLIATGWLMCEGDQTRLEPSVYARLSLCSSHEIQPVTAPCPLTDWDTVVYAHGHEIQPVTAPCPLTDWDTVVYAHNFLEQHHHLTLGLLTPDTNLGVHLS